MHFVNNSNTLCLRSAFGVYWKIKNKNNIVIILMAFFCAFVRFRTKYNCLIGNNKNIYIYFLILILIWSKQLIGPQRSTWRDLIDELWFVLKCQGSRQRTVLTHRCEQCHPKSKVSTNRLIVFYLSCTIKTGHCEYNPI